MGAAVILPVLLFHGSGAALTVTAWWVPWYAGAVFFVLTHLGMVDDVQGAPHQYLLLPNAVSFMRLALAPLALWPCLTLPIHPVTGPVFALVLTGLSLSDLLDGFIARRQNLCTRLGRSLDFLADMALLTFLAIGLYLAGVLPVSLLWLLAVRYPLMMIGVLVLYFARGPAPLSPTVIGRVTTFATHAVLLVLATRLLLQIDLPLAAWLNWLLWGLHFLIAANILYLAYAAKGWASTNARGAGAR